MNNIGRCEKIIRILEVASIFLLPITGWNPFLLLWCVFLILLIKKSTDKVIKKIYLVILFCVILLVILNLTMRFLKLEYIL